MQYLAGFLAVSALGLVSQTAEATVCDSCVVSNDHTKDYSTPFKSPVANFPACQQYSESACCSLDVTTQCVPFYSWQPTNQHMHCIGTCIPARV